LDTPSIQQIADANTALGLAAAYVVAHPPFGSYRADKLIGSIAGQVQRRHYAFAVRDGSIVGYLGWALCQQDVADARVEQGHAPTSEQCRQGDVVVIVIAIADDKTALRQLVAYARKLHAGKVYVAG
jgi:hemolysin-activating ACP:hemolysin acyltransferase